MNFNELSNHLDNELGKVYNRILINGKWGIGKSYFIQNYLRDKKSIYVSLFGLTSIDEMYNITLMQLSDGKQKIYNNVIKMFNKLKASIPISIPLPVLGKISFNIPDINIDIKKQINEKLGEEQKYLYFIIDDLERKSSKINIEDILGFIEKLSTNFEKIKVIIICNEDEITKNTKKDDNGNDTYSEDCKKYFLFKEKVIDKTYNIDGPSKEAVESIIDKYVDDLEIEKYDKKIKQEILQYISDIKYSNLRTLIKGLNFFKLIIDEVKLGDLEDVEINYLMKECLAITFEDIDKIQLNKIEQSKNNLKGSNEQEKILISMYEEEKKNFSIRVLSYLNEPEVGTNQIYTINCLYEIYRDINFNDNIENLRKKLKKIKNSKEKKQEERLFSKSEKNVEQSVNNFIESSIKKVNENYNIISWINDFNNIYYFSNVIGKENIIIKYEKELKKSVDEYIKMTENLEYAENEMYFYLNENNAANDVTLKNFITQISEKILYTQYNNFINDILKNNKEDYRNYIDTLNNLFDVFDKSNFDGKDKILKQIEANRYFWPNLNENISEKDWHIASIILENSIEKHFWEEMQFQNIIKNDYENYDKMGKYRIDCLLKKYNLELIRN